MCIIFCLYNSSSQLPMSNSVKIKERKSKIRKKKWKGGLNDKTIEGEDKRKAERRAVGANFKDAS